MKCRYTSRDSESGYALLMVVFFAAVMLITVAVAGPNLLTQGKREKEDELIWRGGQYARAVRFYYRKNGRFPHSLEDLTKAQNEIHFLRKPYKDPMNSEDGSWRLIYVGPGGQLIGSVKRKSLLQPTGLQAALGLPGQGAAPTGSSQPGQGTAPTDPGQPATGPGASGAPGAPGASGTAPANPSGPQQPGQPAAPATTDTGPQGPVIGGNIIGVGSKVKRHSIKVYDGGITYEEWDFLWDPTKEQGAAAQPGTPAGIRPGGNPPGGNPPGPMQQQQQRQQQQQQQQPPPPQPQ